MLKPNQHVRGKMQDMQSTTMTTLARIKEVAQSEVKFQEVSLKLRSQLVNDLRLIGFRLLRRC